MRRIVRVIGLGVLGAVLVAAPVSAGKPQMERRDFDDTSVDEFLSDACGVEVNTHLTGHLIIKVFTDADGDPVASSPTMPGPGPGGA